MNAPHNAPQNAPEQKTPRESSVVPLPRRADGGDGGAPSGPGARRDLGNWRRPALWGGLVIALAFGALGTWALTAPLDGAVSAPGEVAVESGRKVVEHPSGGQVAEVLVEGGDRVEEGQLLVRLDTERAEAAFQAARSRLDNALARRARLVAERDRADSIAFPQTLLDRREDADVAEALEGERAQFTERRESLQGRIVVQEGRIDQLQERIAGLEAERQSVLRQIAIMDDELDGLRELEAKGYYPRIRVLERERELAQLQGRAGRLRAEIAEARERISEARETVQQTRREFRAEVLANLRETETRIADHRQELAQARVELDNRYILAGFSGRVHDLQVASAGDVVRPGDTMLQIVPEEGALVVEARVAPNDIDLVRAGMDARVRMTALSQSATLSLAGQVKWVSPDRLQDPDTGQAYFTARIEIPGEELGKLGEQELKSGMPAQVMIQTGERTLAEYLWKPIGDAMSRGLIEP